MNLQQRIDLLSRLGEYMLSGDEEWNASKERASGENGWFAPEFINLAARNIATNFLQKDILKDWVKNYGLKEPQSPKIVGIVMAGNIPMVGFHDMLCVFISGHKAMIKLSSKDAVLLKHLVAKMADWNEEVNTAIQFADMLKGCDAYIATGSNNSAAHFEYYFKKYPHIIRRNRTSVAILTGNETNEELSLLADDIFLYFGLGCRNVTKIFVPKEYDFIPLLKAFKKFDRLADNHKYKNNYDYNLALHILNKKFYMSTEALLLAEETSVFSPISQLNYEFYDNINEITTALKASDDIQCVAGNDFTKFGGVQSPSIYDYADGVDTLQFLSDLV